MGQIKRRSLLQAGAATAVGLALGRQEAEAEDAPSFSFVHITDTHIQPELRATFGVRKAFDAINALPGKPDFGLVGGDLVMDAALVDLERAKLVYDLWDREAEALKFPLHYSIGNHDVFDLASTGKPGAQNPNYGKGLWQSRLKLANRYSSFEHKGWLFVTLDSVGITPDGKWDGFLDKVQMTWLDDLLRKTPKTKPIVFLTHFPIFTIFSLYTSGTTSALPPGLVVKNGLEFFNLIQGYNVKAVFQGHTHVLEECSYLGAKYITGGAVCGEWWKGKRLGVHSEGFIVATCRGEELSWKYVDYGWKAEKA